MSHPSAVLWLSRVLHQPPGANGLSTFTPWDKTLEFLKTLSGAGVMQWWRRRRVSRVIGSSKFALLVTAYSLCPPGGGGGPGSRSGASHRAAASGLDLEEGDDEGTSRGSPASSQPSSRTTFNEDEYTKITTPRQDMLFKKGYLGRKKTTPAPSQDTTDAQSAESVESEQYYCDEQLPQFMYPTPTGYIDQAGVYYVPNYEVYDPYTGGVTVVVGPAPGFPGGGCPVLAALPCGPVPLQPVEWFQPQHPLHHHGPPPPTLPPPPPPTLHHLPHQPPPPPPPLYNPLRKKSCNSIDSQNWSGQSSEPSCPPGSPQDSAEQCDLQPYVYPGYMFGPPVYNVNGMNVQGVVPAPLPQPPSDQSKRRKKRRRRRRGGVTDEGSESSCEEVCSIEAPGSSASSSKTNSDSGIATDPCGTSGGQGSLSSLSNDEGEKDNKSLPSELETVHKEGEELTTASTTVQSSQVEESDSSEPSALESVKSESVATIAPSLEKECEEEVILECCVKTAAGDTSASPICTPVATISTAENLLSPASESPMCTSETPLISEHPVSKSEGPMGTSETPLISEHPVSASESTVDAFESPIRITESPTGFSESLESVADSRVVDISEGDAKSIARTLCESESPACVSEGPFVSSSDSLLCEPESSSHDSEGLLYKSESSDNKTYEESSQLSYEEVNEMVNEVTEIFSEVGCDDKDMVGASTESTLLCSAEDQSIDESQTEVELRAEQLCSEVAECRLQERKYSLSGSDEDRVISGFNDASMYDLDHLELEPDPPPVAPPRRKKSTKTAEKLAAELSEDIVSDAVSCVATSDTRYPITSAVTKWLEDSEEDEEIEEAEEALTGQKNGEGNPFLAPYHSVAGTRVASTEAYQRRSRVREMCDPVSSVNKYYRLALPMKTGPGPFPCGVCCIIQ